MVRVEMIWHGYSRESEEASEGAFIEGAVHAFQNKSGGLKLIVDCFIYCRLISYHVVISIETKFIFTSEENGPMLDGNSSFIFSSACSDSASDAQLSEFLEEACSTASMRFHVLWSSSFAKSGIMDLLSDHPIWKLGINIQALLHALHCGCHLSTLLDLIATRLRLTGIVSHCFIVNIRLLSDQYFNQVKPMKPCNLSRNVLQTCLFHLCR